jgi:glycosyltransferase involved in cell wall biosynthesis
MRRRRVCLVVAAHWSDIMGGAQFQVKLLVDRLVAHEALDTYYVTRSARGGIEASGYEVRVISSGQGFLEKRLMCVNAGRLLGALDDIAPDVVYQRVRNPYTGIACHYARRKGARFIWHVASDADVGRARIDWRRNRLSAPLRYLDDRVSEYGVRRADVIVAQTRFQALKLGENFGLDGIEIIPNWHPDVADRGKEGKEKLKVLWLGNLKWVKRPDLFLALAKQLEDMPDVEFLMAGSPSGDKNWQREFEADLHGRRNLRYLGALSLERVEEALAETDLLVNTSEYEGFSNTFIQAWLHRVPVLTLNVDPDGVMAHTGIGIKAGDVANLAREVRDLLTDTPRRMEMGRDARNHAVASHSMANADRLISIFNRP